MSYYSHFIKVDLPQYKNLWEEFNEMDIQLKGNQICLNAPADTPDDYHRGCGSLFYNWETAVYNNKKELIKLDEWNDPLKESDFTDMCSAFSGTSFEKMYNDMKSQFNIGRVRIIKLASGKVMSWHADDSKRLHYPIKTQTGCSMVIDNEVMHIPQDTWWLTDTTLKHTAFNASRSNRYHIVAAII